MRGGIHGLVHYAATYIDRTAPGLPLMSDSRPRPRPLDPQQRAPVLLTLVSLMPRVQHLAL
jgi:hypothetical protein